MSRIKYEEVPHGLFSAMGQTEEYLKGVNLDYKLLELMRVLVSGINNCGYCLDMHFKEAEAAGESLQRLYSVRCWRETPYYTDKERAVLDWAEKLTLVSEKPELDAAYEALSEYFSQADIANLSLAVSAINTWNRLMLGFGFEAGHYKVSH